MGKNREDAVASYQSLKSEFTKEHVVSISNQEIPWHDLTTEMRELSHQDAVATSAACTRILDVMHD